MLFSRSMPSSLPLDEIRKRAHILVVDDEPFPYEELFVRDGYHITKWSQVENLSQMTDSHFDLILLDLSGIAPADAPTLQGLGVLEHVKRENPAQLIIAYSAKDWGVEAQRFLYLADGVLRKSEDYVLFKTKVDELLTRRYSLGFFLDKINLVVGPQVEYVPKLVPKAMKAIRREDTKPLARYIGSRLKDEVTIDRVLVLAGIAAQVLAP